MLREERVKDQLMILHNYSEHNAGRKVKKESMENMFFFTVFVLWFSKILTLGSYSGIRSNLLHQKSL